MKFKYQSKAFTLAEVMIALTIIGIISAVVIPVAFQSKPDENIIKFKKAHNTLYQTIRTLINSDKYYCNGDLGMMADCETMVLYNSTSKGTYFCETMADVMTTKKVDCAGYGSGRHSGTVEPFLLSKTSGGGNGGCGSTDVNPPAVKEVTSDTIAITKNYIDSGCKDRASRTIGAEIITSDNIVFYQMNIQYPFGMACTKNGITTRVYTPPGQNPANIADENGFDIAYKVMCIDVDGIPAGGSENCDDEKDICPFGYGIRADGHIMTGARADEWLKKDFQGEE